MNKQILLTSLFMSIFAPGCILALESTGSASGSAGDETVPQAAAGRSARHEIPGWGPSYNLKASGFDLQFPFPYKELGRTRGGKYVVEAAYIPNLYTSDYLLLTAETPAAIAGPLQQTLGIIVHAKEQDKALVINHSFSNDETLIPQLAIKQLNLTSTTPIEVTIYGLNIVWETEYIYLAAPGKLSTSMKKICNGLSHAEWVNQVKESIAQKFREAEISADIRALSWKSPCPNAALKEYEYTEMFLYVTNKGEISHIAPEREHIIFPVTHATIAAATPGETQLIEIITRSYLDNSEVQASLARQLLAAGIRSSVAPYTLRGMRVYIDRSEFVPTNSYLPLYLSYFTSVNEVALVQSGTFAFPDHAHK